MSAGFQSLQPLLRRRRIFQSISHPEQAIDDDYYSPIIVKLNANEKREQSHLDLCRLERCSLLSVSLMPMHAHNIRCICMHIAFHCTWTKSGSAEAAAQARVETQQTAGIAGDLSCSRSIPKIKAPQNASARYIFVLEWDHARILYKMFCTHSSNMRCCILRISFLNHPLSAAIRNCRYQKLLLN